MKKEHTQYNYGQDPVLAEDLAISARSDLPLDELEGSTVLVTGATGLVGSALIRTLLAVNRIRSARIRILAMVRNPQKARLLFGDDLDDPQLHLIVADLSGDVSGAFSDIGRIDWIFHAAAVTSSKTMVSEPVRTIHTALEGTDRMLRLAGEKKCRGMVYLSSMEVYGDVSRFALDVTDVREEDIGYLDPLNVRSDYPESKRMCENLCVAYASQYQVPVKIARLAQTFGAGILPGENRVFAQFARSVLYGEDIVLHTKGLSEGNYCYLRDTVQALLILAVRGKSGQAYNIANEKSHTTIAAMAQMVCDRIAGGKIRVVFDIPKDNVFGYAADAHMKLNADRMRALGWEPQVGLEESYRRLIASMKFMQFDETD